MRTASAKRAGELTRVARKSAGGIAAHIAIDAVATGAAPETVEDVSLQVDTERWRSPLSIALLCRDITFSHPL